VRDHLSIRIRRDEAGFTLVELLVVITILGILATIVVLSVRGATDRGREAACRSDVRMLMNAQEIQFAQHGAFVADQDDLVTAGYLARSSVHYKISPPVPPASVSTTYRLERTDPQCPLPPTPAP
jgi:prepilin-type N-terminal cleavage/methylation domain-containing protein